MITASTLFAQAHGKRFGGKQRCYYCGGECDDTHRMEGRLSDAFSNRDIIPWPDAEYCCSGCVLSMMDTRAEPVAFIDCSASVYDPKKPRLLAPRRYSWLLTERKAFAFTKAHTSIIRGILTDADKLPDGPFAVVIAKSGQKQLIFRAPANLGKSEFDVQMEDERITVSPEKLRGRVELASEISRNLGKPTLEGNFGFNAYLQAKKLGMDHTVFERWTKVRHEPLSRLAAWLAESKPKPQEG